MSNDRRKNGNWKDGRTEGQQKDGQAGRKEVKK
jgi:hypothetical protein